MDSQNQTGFSGTPAPRSQFVQYGQQSQSPPPSVTPPVQSPPVMQVRPNKSSRHWSKWTFIMIAILLICAGGYVAYAAVLNPGSNVEDSIKIIDISRQVRANTDINFISKEDGKNVISASLVATADRTNTTPRYQVSVDNHADYYGGAAEIRFIDDVIYGRITRVPKEYNKYASEYLNVWYSASLATLEKLSSVTGEVYSRSLKNRKTFSEMYNILKDANVISDPKFSGITFSTRSYSVTINKDALAAFIVSLARKNMQDLDVQKYLDVYKVELDKILAAIEIDPIIIKTSLFGNEITGISIALLAKPTFMPESKGVALSADTTYEYNGEGMDVDIPEDAISIEKALETSRKKGVQAMARSYISQIRAMFEIYYDENRSSYSNGCSSQSVKESLVDLRQRGVNPVCRSNATAYIIYVSLTQDITETYYCVDSTGLSADLVRPPTGFVCK